MKQPSGAMITGSYKITFEILMVPSSRSNQGKKKKKKVSILSNLTSIVTHCSSLLSAVPQSRLDMTWTRIH